MEFPCMVYQSPGDQIARGGTFKYKVVNSKEEMTNALTKGWFQNAQEAMDALNKPAEKEEIDIRMYSIIYDAINDLKDAMEGMLSPEFKEEITGSAEIRETFKVSKIGTIAGCMVTNGKIYRNAGVRLIREGVVIFTGELSSLKRFKDDVKEVAKGYDCGLQIKNYNDIKNEDIVEFFQEVAVKKTL